MKEKTIYKCTECDYQTPKWIGKCPSCNAWSSFKEEITNSFNKTRSTKKIQARSTSPLTERKTDYKRIQTGIVEFDRVMGSGIVPGSLTLLSGEPGIGNKPGAMKMNQLFQSDLVLGNTDGIGDLTYDFTRKILYVITPGLNNIVAVDAENGGLSIMVYLCNDILFL